MPFVDETTIHVKAGDGGNGCVSFRREKHVPRGGPDGGDGGNGGSVIVQASSTLHSLIDFSYRSHFKAKSGVHGKGKNCAGQNGLDCLVAVPVGTLVRERDTGRLLGELTEDGQELCAAQGGIGGQGNARFTTSTNRAPRFSQKGTPGEEFWLRLELKLFADIGLVGLPNAGKSTLLSALSKARPKIASYPFTTLEPQLGVLFLQDKMPLVIADLPGLIEGAHQGVGLGHRFLRHVERTRILLHLVDITNSPWDDYQVVFDELSQYGREVLLKKRLIVVNKIDCVDETVVREVRRLFEHTGCAVSMISALEGSGLDELKQQIARAWDESGRLENDTQDDDPPSFP